MAGALGGLFLGLPLTAALLLCAILAIVLASALRRGGRP